MDGNLKPARLETLAFTAGAMPPERPLDMPTQDMRRVQEHIARTSQTAWTTWLARAIANLSALAITGYGIWEMIGIVGFSNMTVLQGVMIFFFGITLAWIAFAATSAIAGFLLPAPRLAEAPLGDSRTALLMPVYNEDPIHTTAALQAMAEALHAADAARNFEVVIVSDSTNADAWIAETLAVDRLRRALNGIMPVRYRRRWHNTGRKVGNIEDFVKRWGGHYDYMIVLDADSLMTGERIVRLVRMMQAHPRIGILQSLVVGMPSESAFARIFQFGMRHGMRSYTMGQAWWVGDCGPFWGHNAFVRIKPFVEDCDLPMLPGKPPLGGHVLSHDQVEATLMRRAGYEVRVLPEEGGSWEENPPTMLDFAQRDVRWCQGNMQYVKLLDLPGLYPMSRFQLVWAILMFLGIPAWTLAIALSPVAAWQGQQVADFPSGLAAGLYIAFLAMYLAPKLAGLVDAMLTKGAVTAYGGPVRFTASATLEILFAFLQGAVSTIRTSLFMVGLLFGKSVVWSGQSRDAHGLKWSTAAKALWPQLVFGTIVCGALLAVSPKVLLWSLPLTAGYLLAIPFSVVTADPRLGAWMKARGLCAIPEDFAPPMEVAAVQGDADAPPLDTPIGHRALGDDASGRLW